RDMILLASADQGKSFQDTVVHKWRVNACPMSSESFAEGPGGVFSAWETEGQVYFGRIDRVKPGIAAIVAAPGRGQGRKHPAVALRCFTSAGGALGPTQAAVRQNVQALEKTLGMSLSDRRGGRVLPTEAAQRLYPYAQRILSLHAEARGAVTGHKIRVTGDLLLAASSIPGEHLLPALLPAFQERYPHLRIRV